MVTPRPPFLTEQDIDGLHDLVGQGLQTVQDFQDPSETLTFTRRTGKGEPTVIKTIRPISIRLGGLQPAESVGGGETTTVGTVKIWSHEVLVDGENVIQPGDQFQWQGHGCRVEFVPPARLGYVALGFRILEGN